MRKYCVYRDFRRRLLVLPIAMPAGAHNSALAWNLTHNLLHDGAIC